MSDEQNTALIERLHAVVKRAWSWDYCYPGNLNIESLIVDLRKEAREAAAALTAAQARIAALEEEFEMYAKDYPSGLNIDFDKAAAKACAALAKGYKK